MSPSCNNNNTTDPVVELDNYYIRVGLYSSPPPNFDGTFCSPPTTFTSPYVFWTDLWTHEWPIEITVKTATASNFWSMTYTGCQSTGYFKTVDDLGNNSTFPYNSFMEGLEIQVPKNRPFKIFCKIYSICGKCSTYPNNVLYSWRTKEITLDPSLLIPNNSSSQVDIGQLEFELIKPNPISTECLCD